MLYAGPRSALAGRSALRAAGVRGHDDDRAIEVVIPADRRVRPVPGIVVRRLRAFDRLVAHHLSPPRLRLEPALLQVAATARSTDRVVAVLADACQSGATSSARLRDALEPLTVLPRRALLAEVLADVTVGVLSPLERRYLRDVERAHALPGGGRQRQEAQHGRAYHRDVEYADQATLVELDGRLRHEASQDRWDDLDRDVVSATTGRLTVRLGWRQFLRPCDTAAAIARILQARGWPDLPVGCGPLCPLS